MSPAELQSLLDATLPDGYIEVVSVSGYQAINLALINDDFPIGPLPRAVMNAVIKIQLTGLFAGAAASHRRYYFYPTLSKEFAL